jgi:hypothetical protein
MHYYNDEVWVSSSDGSVNHNRHYDMYSGKSYFEWICEISKDKRNLSEFSLSAKEYAELFKIKYPGVLSLLEQGKINDSQAYSMLIDCLVDEYDNR